MNHLLQVDTLDRLYADWFFNPKITSHPEIDFHLCTELNKYKFVLKAKEYSRGLKLLKKYSV